MRNIVTIGVCVAILFLVVSCKQEPQSEDYAIEKISQPLSNDEIVSAFGALGLTIERFNCVLPKRTPIKVYSEQYVDGKPYGGNTGGTLYVDEGLQKLILFKKEREDQTVEFSLKAGGGSIGCGQASLEGYGGRTYGFIDIDKLTPNRQPIYVYAANRSGIEGFSSQSVDIDALVEKYAFLMVLYVSTEDS